MNRSGEGTLASSAQLGESSIKVVQEERKKPSLSNLLFALLFAYAEPLPHKKIREVLGWEKKTLLSAAEALQKELEPFPITLMETVSGYLLVTKKSYAPYLKKLLKPPFKKLNPKTLETLAIIAYRQPITRMEIERIRGVQVDGSLETLMRVKLVRITGRKEGLGKPYLYGTTDLFLRFFGLSSLRELPKLELDLEKLMEEKLKQVDAEEPAQEEREEKPSSC